jgi:hypothetical protein
MSSVRNDSMVEMAAWEGSGVGKQIHFTLSVEHGHLTFACINPPANCFYIEISKNIQYFYLSF